MLQNGHTQLAAKNQLGINASKFLVLFDEKVNNLDLTYRCRVSRSLNIRLSTSIDISTSDSGTSDLGVRIGADKYFKKNGSFNFYCGVDLNFARNKIHSSDRKNHDYGIHSFIGFLYQIGDNFSLSTEPTLAFIRNTTSNPSSFNPSANESFNEIKLLNIGQVKVSFHF